MKKILFIALLLTGILISCEKEKEDIADTESNEIEDINSLETFEAKINTGVSVVFFHASWCSICAEQRPAVEATSEESDFSNVFFGEVEFETNDNINQNYSVNGFPTLVFYKDGVEMERFNGKGHTQESIEAEINVLL